MYKGGLPRAHRGQVQHVF